MSWFWKLSYDYIYLCVNYLWILIVNGIGECLELFNFVDIFCIMFEVVFLFKDLFLCYVI